MKEPLWLSVARLTLGVKEIPGVKSELLIMRWAADIGVPSWFNNDDQAWCAVWVNRICLAMQWALSGKSFDLLRARTFETWGQKLTEPALGAVLVFNRPEGAHVGFYVGERADAYRVLGGNQSNAVSETWIAKNRLVAIRWPNGVPLPSSGRVMLNDAGSPLSTNEA